MCDFCHIVTGLSYLFIAFFIRNVIMYMMNLSLNKKYLSCVALIIFAFIFFYSFIFSTSSFYQSIKWKAIDLLFSVQKIFFAVPQEIKQIVIVAVDDKAIKKAKMGWPWERKAYAEIIRKLNSFSPSLICLDFTFAGEGKDKQDNLLLSTAIRENKNIILSSYYDSNMELVSPLPEFSQFALKTGYVNKIKDLDGIIRRFHPFHKDKSGSIDNYTIEIDILSSLYHKAEKDIFLRIPSLSDGSCFINYLAKPKDFIVYSLVDVFSDNIKPDIFKGRIILFGGTTDIIHDIYQTPLGNMPGVYILANTLTTIMSQRYLVAVNRLISYFIFIFFAFLTGLLTFKYGIGKGIIITILASILLFAISIIIFRQGFIFDWFTAVIIILPVSILTAFYRYVVIIKLNMEDLRKANIEIKNAQKEIVRREQLSTIGKLTSSIIHELSNPLRNVTNCIEVLKEKRKIDEETEEFLEMAYKEINRAKRIGEDLKTSYTPHVEDKIPADINGLVTDIAKISQQAIKAKGIALKLDLDNDLPLIPVSLDKIKQVFLNMLLNAADATESGKSIYIITKKQGTDWADIIFKDEGCGISKEQLPKIFDAFQTTKKDKKGTGLGLFISYEIVKAHKGRITVESEPAKGAIFTIKLPINPVRSY